jgi:hypothetical protein
MIRFLFAALAVTSVVSAGSPPPPAPAALQMPPDGMARSAPRFIGAGVLRESDSATHNVPIDIDADCTFLVTASGGHLTIGARSPSGRTFSSRDSSHGGQSDMMGEMFGAWLGIVAIEKPERGTWTVTISAEDFPDSVSHEAYQLQLMQDVTTGGPQLTLFLSDSTRHRGDPLVVRASLLEAGKPVPGARVKAAVGTNDRDDGPATSIQLLDDGRPPDEKAGDGTYAGMIPQLTGSGFAGAEVTASRRGVQGLPDFDREARANFLISKSRSRLTGKVRDFARDADGDGLNEEIVFAVGVSVTDATSLRLVGEVKDAEGRKAWSFAKDARFEPGSAELELVCDTEELAKNNVPGPLVLDTLTLYESETYATLDQATPAYRTRPYSRIDFMHDAIRLVGSGTAHGVDLDRDGRFDALDVEMPIEIRFPGPYYTSAVLACGSEWVADADVRQEFAQGRNTVRLRFSGSCIANRPTKGKWNIDGTYVGYSKERGDTRPSPKYGYTAGEVFLTGVPSTDRFESTPSKPGGDGFSSHCR